MKTIAFVSALLFALPAYAGSIDPAAVKLDIANPMTVTIRHSMQQRVSRLVKFYEPGVIGMLKNGDLGVHDSSRLGKLATRQIVEKLIDAENNDRQSLIAAVAVANAGRNAPIEEFRVLMTEKWQREMHSGWWYQDAQGTWLQKP